MTLEILKAVLLRLLLDVGGVVSYRNFTKQNLT